MTSLRPAQRDDIDTVATLWLEAAAWLRERGSDQWQYPIKMHNIEAAVDQGTCWLVEDDQDVPIGTVTLDPQADALWTPDDNPEDALYVHRLVVAKQARGVALGSRILDWAGARTEAAGRHFLRLDAWTSNPELHSYYLGQGFHLVRIMHGDDVVSGALFERPASYRLTSEPVLPTKAPRPVLAHITSPPAARRLPG